MSTGYDIDYDDTTKLWSFTMENCKLAETYKVARIQYGEAIKYLKLRLAKAYLNEEVSSKISEEKAYLALAELDPQAKAMITQSIDSEQEYKALEKLLEARQSAVNFNQSLLRTLPKE